MQIEKTHHDSGLGIYAISQPVKTKAEWEVAKAVAREMVEWLDKENGHFKGEHPNALAMAHCQVAPVKMPWRLFVVNHELLVPEKLEKDAKQNLKNTFFEARAIFNCEILETPLKITRKVPKRHVEKTESGETQLTVTYEDKEIDNIISVPEGCMSFDHRKAKNKDRYHTIKVKYQYVGKGLLGGEKIHTFEGEVSGLKAHVIQHEVDHFNAINMYH